MFPPARCLSAGPTDCLHLTIRIAYASAVGGAGSARIPIRQSSSSRSSRRCIPPLEAAWAHFRVGRRTRTLCRSSCAQGPHLPRDRHARATRAPSPPSAAGSGSGSISSSRHLPLSASPSESALQLARMVGARAAEAIVATHVSNAIEFCGVGAGSADGGGQATDHYLREFSLAIPARRTWSRSGCRPGWSAAELTAHDDGPLPESSPASAFTANPGGLVRRRRWSGTYDLLELEPGREVDVGGAERLEGRGVPGPDLPDFEAEDDRRLAPGRCPSTEAFRSRESALRSASSGSSIPAPPPISHPADGRTITCPHPPLVRTGTPSRTML